MFEYNDWLLERRDTTNDLARGDNDNDFDEVNPYSVISTNIYFYDDKDDDDDEF